MEDASLPHHRKGMESVVATVSGYHGSERFKLIKLISQTRASYVGAMNQSTTHLICWKFKGRKYELARKFKMVIVNHRWVEDCIRHGRRVPEHPYISQCGQEVGSLRFDIPLVADKTSLLLHDHSNECVLFKKPVIDIESEEIDQAVWIGSSLLNKNSSFTEPERRKSNAHRLLRKTVKKILKQDYSPSIYCFEEPPLSDFLRTEKRSNTTSAEPSRKSRRLGKKNARRNILESFSDSDEECHSIRAPHQHNEIAAPSETSDGGAYQSISRVWEACDDRFYNRMGIRIEGMEDVEEITNLNDVLVFEDSNLCKADCSSSLFRTPQHHCSNVDDHTNDIEHITRLSTSTKLSCVICWTNFSSTRGVLPCGHRFCFSCIQSWANQMASRRKISTCPLCKASFLSITKVDDAVCSDQKIYSQTIPEGISKRDVYILPHGETSTFGEQPTVEQVCGHCCCREPEDLLIKCHICQIRCIHSYCLDPPLFPWTCADCMDIQMLYQNVRLF